MKSVIEGKTVKQGKGKLKILLISLFSTFPFFLTYTLPLTTYGAEDYFSKGIEQYLKGDLEEAIGSLEQALKAEPENEKIKEFSVKLLLEAAGRAYGEHKPNKAISYLDKARKLAPQNKQVQELYSLIQEEVQLSTAPVVGKIQDEKKDLGYAEALARARKAKRLREKSVEQHRRVLPPGRTEPSAPTKPGRIEPSGPPRPVGEGRRLFPLLFVIIGVVLAAGLVIFGAIWVLQQANKNLQFRVEMEREQKRDALAQLTNLRKEKESAEKQRKEEEEKLKREQLSRQGEKIVGEDRRVLPSRQTAFAPRSGRGEPFASTNKEKESFIQQQTLLLRTLRKQFRQRAPARGARFDDPTLPQELPDQRLLQTALNLYRINPELTLETLKQLTKSEDKWERLQAVWMLGELPTMDGAQIIMDLWNDPDYHVKRGVIRTLSKLDKIYEFPKPVHAKIEEELSKAKTEEKWIF